MENKDILTELKSKFLDNEFEIGKKILKDIEKEVLVCGENYEEGIKFTGNFCFGIGIEPQIILYLNNINDFYEFTYIISHEFGHFKIYKECGNNKKSNRISRKFFNKQKLNDNQKLFILKEELVADEFGFKIYSRYIKNPQKFIEFSNLNIENYKKMLEYKGENK